MGRSDDGSQVYQVSVRWSLREFQVKFKISLSKLGKGLGEGQMRVRWGSHECQWNVRWMSNLNLSLTSVDVKLVTAHLESRLQKYCNIRFNLLCVALWAHPNVSTPLCINIMWEIKYQININTKQNIYDYYNINL